MSGAGRSCAGDPDRLNRISESVCLDLGTRDRGEAFGDVAEDIDHPPAGVDVEYQIGGVEAERLEGLVIVGLEPALITSSLISSRRFSRRRGRGAVRSPWPCCRS